MRKLTITTIIALSVAAGPASPLRAEMATIDEALTVANNWVSLVIAREGDWGGSQTAYVEGIQQFRRGQRVIGYFCDVDPVGFIVVSLRKELAPIKAYSDQSNLDPESDEGMTDLLKAKMAAILTAIEGRLGPISMVQSVDLHNVLQIDYRPAWRELQGDSRSFDARLESGVSTMNYQEEKVLLDTSWHQDDPYNSLCPAGDTGCRDCCPDDDENTCKSIKSIPSWVGCVATAGAQIMKYWNWPPYGKGSNAYEWDGDDSCRAGATPGAGRGWLSADFGDSYDWLKMPWALRGTSASEQINAVAELCYEVGVAVEMDYGVCGSGAPTAHMERVFEDHYYYHRLCSTRDRIDYHDPVTWFELMKGQFNLNRPIQYDFRTENSGHSLVADGWQEIGSVPTRQYHMNYGQLDTSLNTWYTLDALFASADPNEEYMLVNIHPAQSVGDRLSSVTYGRDALFPYRYFDQDAEGGSATFAAGQELQFLPGVKVTCTGSGDDSIRFVGTSSNNTRLFSIKGTSSGGAVAGVKVYNGAIKLSRNGSLRFH